MNENNDLKWKVGKKVNILDNINHITIFKRVLRIMEKGQTS